MQPPKTMNNNIHHKSISKIPNQSSNNIKKPNNPTFTHTHMNVFTTVEDIEIEKINIEFNDITQSIHQIEQSLIELSHITQNHSQTIENTFEQLLQTINEKKRTLITEFEKISVKKKDILIEQLLKLKMHSTAMNKFRTEYENMILGESHDNNIEQRKYILTTTNTLLSNSEQLQKIPLINPNIKITNFDTKFIHHKIRNLGIIDACNVPFPPNVKIEEIHAKSCKIQFTDNPMKNTHSATEFKIEILKKNTINYYSNSNTHPANDCQLSRNLWEIVMLCDDGENECFIRDLQPFTTYMLRVSSWNINGWSIPCSSLFFKTKPLSKLGNRLLYLAPSLKYQRMLDENKTSYFQKWIGFHITVGGRHPSGQISASEIAQQLSEMGLKKAQLSIQQIQQKISDGSGVEDGKGLELKEYLWKVPHRKWRVLSGKDLIVLGLDDDIPLFSIASKFLDSKKWTNVKHRNFHLTLGLKKDLNKNQIQKLARVLVSKTDCVEWEWVSVKERPDGRVIWHQRFPAYDLA